MEGSMTALEELYTFGADVVPGVSLTNFYPPETGFVWSSHKWCEIRFDVDPEALSASHGSHETALDIALDLDVFKAPPDFEGQDVLLYVNGARLGSRFVKGRITVMLIVPLYLVRARANVITIDTPDAARPIQHGFNDTRQLGIQLFSVRTTIA